MLWPLVFTVAVIISAVIFIGSVAWDDAFLSKKVSLHSAIPYGDHLQLAYELWLWRDSVETFDHAPWKDAYQFAASGEDSWQPFGWPFALVTVPVDFLAGPVAAYNVMLFVAFVASAWAAYGLARELGASRAASAVGGFAFAFAPFRLVQTSQHANAFVAFLIPLFLLLIERALIRPTTQSRRSAWLGVLVGLSVVAAGEPQVAVFTAGLAIVYTLFRASSAPPGRIRSLIPPMAVLITISAALVFVQYRMLVEPTVAGRERSAIETLKYTPRPRNFLPGPRTERYAYPGAVIVALALVGARSLLKTARLRRVGIALTAAVLGAWFLAFAPGFGPVFERAWRAIPFFAYVRTPARILIVAVTALSVLAAFAIDRIPKPKRSAFAALFCVLILADTPHNVFAENPTADPLRSIPTGATLLELPPFPHNHPTAAIYSYLVTTKPGPRAGGYSPFIPAKADEAQRRTYRLAETPLEECRWESVTREMGIEYVAVHTDLFGGHLRQWFHDDGFALVAALDHHSAFSRISNHDRVFVYEVIPSAFSC